MQELCTIASHTESIELIDSIDNTLHFKHSTGFIEFPLKMINESIKLLVVEGYARESRDTLAESGMALASDLYKAMLLSIAPNAIVDIVTPADVDTSLPEGVALNSYDGVAITGSNLSVLDDV